MESKTQWETELPNSHRSGLPYRWIFTGVILLALGLFMWLGITWDALSLDGIKAADIGSRLFGFAAIALAIERATEVFVRLKYGDDELKLNTAISAYEKQIKVKKDLAHTMSATQGGSGAQVMRLESAASSLMDDARYKSLLKDKSTLAYLCNRTALICAVLVALAFACGGLRFLEGLLGSFPVDLPGRQLGVMKLTDTILTSALLAGGADGIHKIISALSGAGKPKA